MKTRSHLIIGSGLMARHFSHYFDLLGIPHERWSRKENSFDDLKQLLSKGALEKVFLAISDSAILPFYETHFSNFRGRAFHFSGALELPGIQDVHPLMSYGPYLYDLQSYKQVPLVSTAEIGLSELPNPKFHIPSESKARYHALCVIAGNFSVLIWQKFFFEMATYGIPSPACLPYFRQINANIEAAPFSALTGPLMRNDIKTMEMNMHSLHGDPFREVYKHMVHAFETQMKMLQAVPRDQQ
jgi:hypothetical protein